MCNDCMLNYFNLNYTIDDYFKRKLSSRVLFKHHVEFSIRKTRCEKLFAALNEIENKL